MFWAELYERHPAVEGVSLGESERIVLSVESIKKRKKVHFRVGPSNLGALETSNPEITDWQCHQVQAPFQSAALEEDGNVHGLHPQPSKLGESRFGRY